MKISLPLTHAREARNGQEKEESKPVGENKTKKYRESNLPMKRGKHKYALYNLSRSSKNIKSRAAIYKTKSGWRQKNVSGHENSKTEAPCPPQLKANRKSMSGHTVKDHGEVDSPSGINCRETSIVLRPPPRSWKE